LVVIASAAGFAISVSSDVRGGPLLLGVIELLVKGDSLSFVEGLESVLVDGGKVDKDVFTTVFGGDEAETLVTEELYLSVASHDDIFCF
jgi:hypothetical protein